MGPLHQGRHPRRHHLSHSSLIRGGRRAIPVRPPSITPSPGRKGSSPGARVLEHGPPSGPAPSPATTGPGLPTVTSPRWHRRWRQASPSLRTLPRRSLPRQSHPQTLGARVPHLRRRPLRHTDKLLRHTDKLRVRPWPGISGPSGSGQSRRVAIQNLKIAMAYRLLDTSHFFADTRLCSWLMRHGHRREDGDHG